MEAVLSVLLVYMCVFVNGEGDYTTCEYLVERLIIQSVIYQMFMVVFFLLCFLTLCADVHVWIIIKLITSRSNTVYSPY